MCMSMTSMPQGLLAPEHSIHRRFGTHCIEERNPIWSSCVALHLDAFDPKSLSVPLQYRDGL